MHAPLRRARRRVLVAPIAAVAVVGFGALPAAAVGVASTTLVSVGSDHDSFSPAVSADGRFVAFVTQAKLQSGDGDGVRDVYVRDTVAGTFELISKNTVHPADNPAMTPDGRFVVFDTKSPLAAQDVDALHDVYRYDRRTATTLLVSRGRQSSVDTFSLLGDSVNPTISADGNRIAFESVAADLVDGDTNGRRDAFVRDIAADFTFRASVRSDEGQAIGGDSREPAISGDGQHVAFTSDASNLATGDTATDLDVFVRDTRSPGTTRLASKVGTGGSNNGPSTSPTISHNGQLVGFQSSADLTAAGSELICLGRIEGRTPDVYTFNVATGALNVVSGSSAAAAHDSDDPASTPAMSADGQRIAFTSNPLNVITCGNPHPDPNDPDPQLPDFEILDGRIMLRDSATSATIRVDRSDSGQFANADSGRPAVSASGTSVAYDSVATNLVASDGKDVSDVFLTRLQ